MRDRLGIGGSILIVWRGLKSLGITRKKKTEHAAERDRPDVQEERELFREEVEPIEPERLVFVDETGVTTAMTPGYGRAPSGERVVDPAPASWESMTVIAALGLDEVRAPLVISGSSNAQTFLAYVEQVLVPALRKGDVVIFDNLASHFTPGVQAAIERVGARVLPLPPYSPDLNPIEEMFSKFKEFLRIYTQSRANSPSHVFLHSWFHAGRNSTASRKPSALVVATPITLMPSPSSKPRAASRK